jgi:hypothetical protein
MQPLALALIVVLTLATAYIHFWVGGTLLLLNAAGYGGLVVLTAGAAVAFRRALPVVLLMLAAYAAVTIVGWAIMGPYFDVAYIAKGIEVVLIGTIAVQLRAMGGEVRESVGWALSIASQAFLLVVVVLSAIPETLSGRRRKADSTTNE